MDLGSQGYVSIVANTKSRKFSPFAQILQKYQIPFTSDSLYRIGKI